MVPSEIKISGRYSERNTSARRSLSGILLSINELCCNQILYRVIQRLLTSHTSYDFNFLKNRDETGKRDYLYYLAIGNARIKEYQLALKYIRGLLQVEPGNRQAQDLENIIKSKMEKEGLIGMAVVGGATLALGGLVGLGIALAKSARK